MSVHDVTLPSGTVVLQVRWREQHRNRSRNFPATRSGRRDARRFDDELDRLRRLGELAHELERRRVTVEELVADWWARRTDLTARTRDDYARHFDLRIRPGLGHRTIASLRPGDVERWMSDLRAAGDGDPTILKASAALQSVLSLAVRDGLIPVNPVAGAKRPRQGRTRLPVLIRPLDVERIRRDLLLRGRHRDVMLLELLAYAGLRPESEAVALRREQIRERTIVVRDTKRGRERTVRLVEPLRASLERWCARQGISDPRALVLPTGGGGPWTASDWRNWQRRVFQPAARWATGLPVGVRARDLRGSFASLLVHEGRNIVEVAAQLGHSPEVCLSLYAQIFADDDPLTRRPAAETILRARADVRTRFARFATPDTTTTREAP